MADAVSLETWKAIVDKAVTDATAGDSKAREFIAVRLIGDGALPLMQLAVREFAQIGSDEEVSAAAELTAEHATSFRASFDESDTPLDYAIVRRVRKADEARKAAECKQRAEKRAARDAAKAATDGK